MGEVHGAQRRTTTRASSDAASTRSGRRLSRACGAAAVALASSGDGRRPELEAGPGARRRGRASGRLGGRRRSGRRQAPPTRSCRLIRASQPDRLLYLGDVYETRHGRGVPARTTRPRGASWRRSPPRPRATTNGATAPEGYFPYWKSVRGKRPPSWYALRERGWKILSLNSETDHGPRSAQVRWLKRQLRGPGNCRIAFWHRPRFNAGLHGDELRHPVAVEAARGQRADRDLGPRPQHAAPAAPRRDRALRLRRRRAQPLPADPARRPRRVRQRHQLTARCDSTCAPAAPATGSSRRRE